MSSMRKCANGHSYDGDQYAACPFCNKSKAQIVFEGAGKTVIPGMTYTPAAPQHGVEGLSKTVAASGMEADVKAEAKKEDLNKTVWETKKKHKIDPVVAWLVCVEGPEKGKSYPLHSGFNFVGRDESNDIQFAYDTISRRNHVRIVYDAKANLYRLVPGDSHDIVYLNNEGLYEASALHAYDKIEIADLKLLFVPFCGDQFKWDE